MRFLGIDPGFGGWACLTEDTVNGSEDVTFFDLRGNEKENEKVQKFVKYLVRVGGITCALERVSPSPSSIPSRSAGAKMFASYYLWSILTKTYQVPCWTPTPAQWQKAILEDYCQIKSKEKSVQWCNARYPFLALKPSEDGKADAFCLSRFAKKMSLER